MLYGKTFLHDYLQTQRELRRFRGTKIAGHILDDKQAHQHAIVMARKPIAWFDSALTDLQSPLCES